MIIPREVKPFDTLELCSLLKITKIDLDKRLKEQKIIHQDSLHLLFHKYLKMILPFYKKNYGNMKVFYSKKKALRKHKVNIGANVLGSIGEVNRSTIKDPYYSLGDMIGKEGIECLEEARGSKGVRILFKRQV